MLSCVRRSRARTGIVTPGWRDGLESAKKVCYCGRTLLAREQRRMRDQYEERLRELERERLTAEQDKAQVRNNRGHRVLALTLPLRRLGFV